MKTLGYVAGTAELRTRLRKRPGLVYEHQLPRQLLEATRCLYRDWKEEQRALQEETSRLQCIAEKGRSSARFDKVVDQLEADVRKHAEDARTAYLALVQLLNPYNPNAAPCYLAKRVFGAKERFAQGVQSAEDVEHDVRLIRMRRSNVNPRWLD